MLHPRFVMASTAALMALAAISACSPADKKEADGAPSAEASDKTGDMELTEAELILPAVKGNPGAAYFSIANQSGGTRVISAITIDGVGRTEVHQTMGTAMNKVDQVEIAPATTLTFAPGELHLMAFDVSNSLKAGGTTKVKIAFISGEELTAPMKITSVTEAAMGGDHEGMDH